MHKFKGASKRVVTKTIFLIAALGATLLLGGCASCSREWKTLTSNVGGGLDRTVTLYDYDGKPIKQWKGKFDISSDNQEVFFDDAQGKRVIIQGGIVVAEEN